MTAILFDGVVQGLQLSLLAVGITLIYGLGGVLNLAHGQFAVVGGVAAALFLQFGLDPISSGFGGILSAGILGLVVDRTLLLPAYRYRGEERLLRFGVVALADVVSALVHVALPARLCRFHFSGPVVCSQQRDAVPAIG